MPSLAVATDEQPSPSTHPKTTDPTSPPPTSTSAPPPELDNTITRIFSTHKTVRGVMICSREGPIIRQSGSVFEGDVGKKYAMGVKKVVDSCKASLIDDVLGAESGSDELKFLRIRTKRHELMITPSEQYLLVVIQDPTQ